MRCEAVERELSARMDGAADRSIEQTVSGHLAECAECRAFQAGARQIRETCRLEVAEPVPDALVDSIVTQLHTRRAFGRSGAWNLRPILAAFLLSALTSAIVFGGISPRSPRTALAYEIPQRIAEASAGIEQYSARFRITEYNFHPQVPVRLFQTRVMFADQERFRAVTEDLSRYPPGDWPRNNVKLEVEGGRWRLESPDLCPRLALPACGPILTQERSVTGREPFDADATLPTDIILPLRTLAGTARVSLAGSTRVAGRDAVKVRLAYRDALPLFEFIQAGGSWRPFHPSDTVILSLDRSNWLPLAFEVRASSSPERAGWASSQGVSGDRAGRVIFEAVTEEVSLTADRAATGISGSTNGARNGGFVDLSLESIAESVGFDPLEPSKLGELTRYRAGTYLDPARRGEALLSYTNGLTWVKVRQTRTWEQPTLFGNVGPVAAPVVLPGGGVGYYEPATKSLGRRLSIHASGWDLYLESNLPGNELLELGGSLAVKGLPTPPEWSVRRWAGGITREQLTLEQALVRAPYVRVPVKRPEGYEVAAVHLITTGDQEGVTVFLRRPGMEADGVGIRVHQTLSESLPPPLDPDVTQVRLGELTLRYSATRGEVEWIEAGVYRSITAPSLYEELPIMVMSMSPLARKG